MKNKQGYETAQAVTSRLRWEIVERLIEVGKSSVQGLVDTVGPTHSAISHQLQVLRMCDVVSAKQDGRHMVYSIAKTSAGKKARAIVRA